MRLQQRGQRCVHGRLAPVRRLRQGHRSLVEFGGTPFPQWIADEPVRDLRVFLQVGQRDLGWDEPDDNRLAANLEVGAALIRRGYGVRLAVGDGGHDGNHGGVLLPDALRWLWR